jgi:hypothetical protein
MLRVRRDLEQRGRTRAKQEIVDDSLVLKGEPGEFVGQREHDMAVADGQKFLLTGRQPPLPCAGQTLRTMPIPTGVTRDGATAAAGTAIHMTT